MLNYRFRPTVSMWWSVKRFVKLAWEVTVLCASVIFLSLVSSHSFYIILASSTLMVPYTCIIFTVTWRAQCPATEKQKLQQTEKTVCVVSICTTFLYLFALWVFAAWFCICLHCEYLQHGSVFVCTVSICSMVLYLFALWVFAAWFCICLHCEYLQHGSVFAACF